VVCGACVRVVCGRRVRRFSYRVRITGISGQQNAPDRNMMPFIRNEETPVLHHRLSAALTAVPGGRSAAARPAVRRYPRHVHAC